MLLVLIIDIRNYKRLKKQVPESFFAPFMDEWFQAVTYIIGSGNGRIDQVMGDGMLCYWNPQTHRNLVENINSAIDSARRLIECAGRFSADLNQIYKTQIFRIGIGISMGEGGSS